MTAVHHCKRCGLPVRYVTTLQDKSQQLDPMPNPEGSVVIVGGLAMTLSKGQTHDGERWMPHAATCPKGRPSKPAGPTAITGLSPLDEADRLARQLMAYAAKLTHRPLHLVDQADCRVAWRYFKTANPGVRDMGKLVAARVVQIVAGRGSEARA